MKRGWLTAAALCCAAAMATAQGKPLFSSQGPQAGDVRQGYLGNCYFYASAAAVANMRAATLQSMMRATPGGYSVAFADGAVERVSEQDVAWAEKMSYDRSTTRWPAVLFRAFAQRVMRQSLIESLERYAIFDSMKPVIAQAVNGNDELLAAYDRAIRAEVDQSGAFNAAQFRSHFKREIAAYHPSSALQAILYKAVDDPAFGEAATRMINENPEMFGVNRAAGNGGQIGRAMDALVGGHANVYRDSREAVAAALWQVVRERRPAAAGTIGYYREHGGAAPSGYAWYSDAPHAYTILDFDGQTVTLRNPWGRPVDERIRISLDEFLRLFWGVEMSSR